jgi:aspartyl protease
MCAFIVNFALLTALASVPYQHNGKLIYLPVTVNDRHLWFTLDSGAMHTIINEAAAHRLGIHSIRTDSQGGAGRGTVRRQHAPPLDFFVGGVRLRVNDPYIIDLSHTGTARQQDGLLGEDFLAAYVVRVDPVKRTFTIYDPATFRYHGTGTALPLRAGSEKLYIPMTLELPNGISAQREARIDTGSEDAASDDLVKQSPVRRETTQGVGLGRPYVDYSGVFTRVQLGPYVIKNAWGPSNPVPTVGMEILRRFTMTFDVPRGRLWLEPNRWLHDPVPAPPT